jgi:twitching motility protein PilT
VPAIDQFFDVLIEHDGSDLHLLEGQPPKIRLHGDLAPIRDEPLTRDEMRLLLSEINKPEQWAQFESTGDLDFAYERNEDARFRCNYYKQIRGYGAVFRLIPVKIRTLEELRTPPVLATFGDLRSGLILVTGPTGSGKSTTLAAILDYINRTYARHIVTIEEPIEFVHPNLKSTVTQRGVHSECKSFADGLKAALREDADVVLVGEMRDAETISLALTAAETGLLVFGTLHTNNARKTIDRIIDAFPSDQQPQIRTLLANSLRGIAAQLLFKRVDKPGRIAVNEVLVSNSACANVIREGATQKLTDVIKIGKGEGMMLMDDSIAEKLEAGIIGGEEAYMKAVDKTRFAAFRGEGGH